MDKAKILCSVRTEILNSISRFIVTKELNKIISGFSLPLNWNYSNDNSYTHPIMQILLKRIAVCAEAEHESMLQIYRQWFPENIHGIEPANYILNNSWLKPRDMIRLLIVAQKDLHNSEEAFRQTVFDSIIKNYSDDSLAEIKEELRALYTSEEIDTIISCFTGYKTIFSIMELKKRVEALYGGTVLETKFVQVLNDLYRLGFIGNYLPMSKIYHWQHRGDLSLIMSDEWRLIIHHALHSSLSIGTRSDYGQNKGRTPICGDVTAAIVIHVNRSFAKVEFNFCGTKYKGQIHISEFGKIKNKYIRSLGDIVHRGDEYRVAIINYNETIDEWNLNLAPLDGIG